VYKSITCAYVILYQHHPMCWRLIIHVSHTWFQASAAKQMRTPPYWAITQRVVIISYRSLGKSYWSHLLKMGPTLEYGTDTLSRNVGKGLPLLVA